jgi:hypothetical protein
MVWRVENRLWQIHNWSSPHARVLILLDAFSQISPALGKFATRQGSAGRRSETELAVPVGHAPTYPLFEIGKPCNALQKQVYRLGLKSFRLRKMPSSSLPKNTPPPQIDVRILTQSLLKARIVSDLHLDTEAKLTK